MSGRLKFLLAILVAGAGLSFWYAVRSSLTDSALSAAILDSTRMQATCDDSDSDGLCDNEETYWSTDFDNPDTDGDGFKDGEEVLSGHDPAKPGPEDLLDDRENLTQKTSRLILGAMLTGDISADSTNYEQSINRIVDMVFQQYDANTAVELDSITIASASASSLIQYSVALTRILGQMLPEMQANEDVVLETIRNVEIADLPKLDKLNPDAYAAFINAIDNEVEAYNERVAAVKSLRVPSALVQYHKSLIQYLRGIQQQYRLVRTITKDPVQGLLSLQVVNTLVTETSTEITDSFTREVTRALP